ncbi:hypothetical protein JCM19992_17270 [Thermostilla marina]
MKKFALFLMMLLGVSFLTIGCNKPAATEGGDEQPAATETEATGEEAAEEATGEAAEEGAEGEAAEGESAG